MTTPSDGPIRTCIGCMARRPQHELVRCGIDASGVVRVGRTLSGRGAWLCGAICVAPARRRRAFDRAFRRAVSPEAIDRLERELNDETT